MVDALVREAILRSLAWNMVIEYPPTAMEVWWLTRSSRVEDALEAMVVAGQVVSTSGRFVLPGHEALFLEHERRDRSFARKWKHAQRLAGMMRWIPTVRFVALCNTMSIAHARDASDIDLFVVVHRGTLWLTRALLAGCAWLVRRRPGERGGERDAWCFSFFIDDMNLKLERFFLAPHDPYFVWWIARLLPVVDDGIGERIWQAQKPVLEACPQAMPWISWRVKPSFQEGAFASWERLDQWMMRLQQRFGSTALWRQAAEPGTAVVLDAHTMKTHQADRRMELRLRYETLCISLDIAPYMDAR